MQAWLFSSLLAEIEARCLRVRIRRQRSLEKIPKGNTAETGSRRKLPSWGTVEQAVHSPRQVEELLIHNAVCGQWYLRVLLFFIYAQARIWRLAAAAVKTPEENPCLCGQQLCQTRKEFLW